MWKNLPEELKSYPNWVCWGRAGSEGKNRKIPYNPLTGFGARPNDPESWVSYEEAAEAVRRGEYAGVGFQFGNSPFVGVDFDHCRDPGTGEINSHLLEWLPKLNSYTEISQSGRGFHVILRGEMPTEIEGVSRNKISLPEWGEDVELEIYNTGRYFALTGDTPDPLPIADAGEALNALYSEAGKLCLERKKTPPQPVQPRTEPSSLSDAEVLEKARKARNGADFAALYDRGDKSAYNGDDSRADMALCNHLAFWSGCDKEQMDRLFRESGLYRPKWDVIHDPARNRTYGQMTIDRAVQDCREVYTPPGAKPDYFITVCKSLPDPQSLTREELLNPGNIAPVYALSPMEQPAVIAKLDERARELHCWQPFQQLKKAAKQQAEQARREKWSESMPEWLDPNGKINEPAFIQRFAGQNPSGGPLCCENGILYGMDGVIEDRLARQWIQEEISPYITAELAPKTDKLLKALKNARNGSLPAPQLDRIHLQNGTLYLCERGFVPEKEFARNRIPVMYDPMAGCPQWGTFLANLLDLEDIQTLQEFFGYILLPTTKAQKALFICGRGGEGKSVVVAILSKMLGNSCQSGKLKNIQERFGLSNLESKLVFVDDDITGKAFESTDVFKEIITANKPVSIERKGIDPYQATVYARVFCCGNNFATALYDNSDGFFRRQLLLLTRPGAAVKQPDRDLTDKLEIELPGIFNWALQGLDRLKANNWDFTVSARSKEAMEDLRRNSCNVIGYMESDYVCWGKDRQVTVKDAYNSYSQWCYQNAEEPLKRKTFTIYLKEHYGGEIKYDTNIRAEGIRSRGFRGFDCPMKWSVYESCTYTVRREEKNQDDATEGGGT